MKPEATGITFQNIVPVDDTAFNILDYIYYFNGGGVAMVDINNDGLMDIFFTSNLGNNKLYLNKGNLVFEDITEKAGVSGKSGWKTGVTVADVNGDGLADIYVCAVSNFKKLKGHNELFINNGNLSFTESADAYGIAVSGFSTQASFFDFDKDGDLDMFLVCHSVHSVENFRTAKERHGSSPQSGDKLFINEAVDGKRHFTEVTHEAGIYNSAIAYGLNVIVGDFNNDNWDDLYVSNDFRENDYYYLNNQNGSFTEANAKAFGHESRFSMGSDAADFNNDGWLDLITLDMLPADEKTLKSSVSDDPFDIYRYKTGLGYHHQYSRNCLQINVGGGMYFSEVGLFAGVAATDWSWSPLAADFDNDGYKDLFISNGIARRPNDLDYIKFTADPAVFALIQNGKTADKEAIDRMPAGNVSNYIFQGAQDLRFENRSEEWGFNQPCLSNGAAYADLDNDGDLDIVINNINSPAMVYKNNSQEMQSQNYLDIQLKGTGLNTAAYGAKVIIYSSGGLQQNAVTASRGFESASTTILHFGLGREKRIDSLTIIWPSGNRQLLKDVAMNQRLLLEEKNMGSSSENIPPTSSRMTLPFAFVDITQKTNIHWKHEENNFVDFNVQALIPHMISTQGPKIAAADVNRDGLDDFFICGARDQPGAMFIQNKDGRFVQQQQALFEVDKESEDVNAVFFDANGDGAPDLFVCSGGNEFWGEEKQLKDRLYMNDGSGKFSKSNGLPVYYGNSSVAVAADVDRDGDLDLFVGGRVISKRYGDTPPSYLLMNDGKGNFSFAKNNIRNALSKIGMVTDATWTDTNMDGWPDLVIVGEWMPVTIFLNNKGTLENKTKEEGLENTSGLWQSVQSADIDNNGFPDLLLGNWGENSKLTATDDHPLIMFVGDIDSDGSIDQLLSVYKDGNYYPFLGKEDLESRFPSIFRKRFATYAAMAGLTVEEIFGDRLKGLTTKSARTLSSSILWHSAKGYRLERLPSPLQWFPVFTWCVDDFNRDGKKDILAAGNFYGVIPFEGRYDAGYGQVLIKNDTSWQTPAPFESGIKLGGEMRSIQKVRTANNQWLYVAAGNKDSLRVFKAVPK